MLVTEWERELESHISSDRVDWSAVRSVWCPCPAAPSEPCPPAGWSARGPRPARLPSWAPLSPAAHSAPVARWRWRRPDRWSQVWAGCWRPRCSSGGWIRITITSKHKCSLFRIGLFAFWKNPILSESWTKIYIPLRAILWCGSSYGYGPPLLLQSSPFYQDITMANIAAHL